MSAPASRAVAATRPAAERAVLDRYLTWLIVEAAQVSRALGHPPNEVWPRLTRTSFDWHAERATEGPAAIAERGRAMMALAGVDMSPGGP